MRGLTQPTRRRFGQGLGAALTLAGLPASLEAHDTSHGIEVGIMRFTFEPPHIEINPGDSVTWVNADLAPHTATAQNDAWDTGPLERGERARVTFESPGEYLYTCAYHPHMKGTVVVRTSPRT